MSNASKVATAAICPECQTPFGLLLEGGVRASVREILSAKTNDGVDRLVDGAEITTVPKADRAYLPSTALPEKIRDAFMAVEEDARKKRNPAGIMSVARGCLDVALKELGQQAGGRRDRINQLAKAGVITHGIAAWAQILWEEGSDAVHDLDADIERAIEHIDFLKLFFEVAFVLPQRIAQASHGTVTASAIIPASGASST